MNVAAAVGGNDRGQLDAGYRGVPVPVSVPMLGLSDIRAVVAADHFTIAHLNDLTLRTMGGNIAGQLCSGNTARQEGLVKPPLTGVGAVSAQGWHALAALEDGSGVTWGSNSYGCIGNGLTGAGAEGPHMASPYLVPGLTRIEAVACFGGSCVALNADGVPLVWGNNRQGQLGLGDQTERTRPVAIPGLPPIIAVAGGGLSNAGQLVMVPEGREYLLVCGDNRSGQLGIGSTAKVLTPRKVTLPSGARIDYVCGMASNLLVKLDDGTAWAAGSDSHSQLGVPTSEVNAAGGLCSKHFVKVADHVVTLSQGSGYTLVSKDDGLTYAVGLNDRAMLGVGDRVNRTTLTPMMLVKGVESLAAGTDHTAMTMPDFSAPPPPLRLEAKPGGVLAIWDWPPVTAQWNVNSRVEPPKPPGGTWHIEKVAAAGREHFIPGQSGVPLEVMLACLNSGFPRDVHVAAPL